VALRLSKDELAEHSGVGRAVVDELLSLGILVPDADDQAFGSGDVFRVRLVAACEAAGMRAESLAKALADGRLSLSFMDLPHYRWAPLSTKTYAEVAAEAGLDVDVALDVVEAGGGIRPKPGDRAREDEITVARLVGLVGGFLDRATLLRTIRVYAESLRRISESEATLFATVIIPALQAQGLSRVDAVDMANRFGAQATELQEDAILTLYRRIQERRWNEVTIEGIEEVLEDMGLYERPARPPAFGFVDLAGYTRLTDERGDDAGARLAADMSFVVHRIARENGGEAVKWLGDGVMLYFRDPSRAVRAAVDIVREAPNVGLPAHAGVAAGPVVVQDGDYFGRTVNMAARIGAHATAGQTLVSADAKALSTDALTFRSMGPVELKGFAAPVPVFEALPAS